MPAAQTRGGGISCGDRHAAGSARLRVDGQPVVLVGDLSEGHAGFPPTPAVEGGRRVFVDGRAVVRAGDLYLDHTNGRSAHVARRGTQSGRYVIDEPLSSDAARLLARASAT